MAGVRPLKVLHLTAGSDAGGVSRYLFNLCEAMDGQGHHVAVAGQRGAWHALFDGVGWDWLELPLKGGPLALCRSARRVRRYIRHHAIELVHSHYRRATLVARLAGGHVPVLVTLHLTGIAMGPVRRWLSDFGDQTLAPSRMARQWLIDRAGVDPAQVTVVPHGIHAARFPLAGPATRHEVRARLGLPTDAVVGAYVGRFDQPKNEDWILDLADISRRKLPDLHVVMMGQGPHESILRNRVASGGLTDRVTMLPYGDPRPIYEAADALLLPSAQEGFSFVCTEAMSVGCAVLRTRTAGTQEHILEGVTGRSVAIDRAAFLREAIDFLADRDVLSRMGQAAARHVRRHLTFHRQLDHTLDLYQRMIDR